MDILESVKNIWFSISAPVFSMICVQLVLFLIPRIEQKNLVKYQDDLIIRWPKTNLWFSGFVIPISSITIAVVLFYGQSSRGILSMIVFLV